MSSAKSTPRNSTELSERVYWCQLHVFQACTWIICTLPSLALVIYLAPKITAFMAAGVQRSSMTVLKLLVLVPVILLFLGLLFLAFLLAAVLNVLVVRVWIRELRPPQARELLLQLYSDPRWLYQSRGTRNFPWWVSLWGGMGKTPRLNRWCERLTAGTIALVYRP